jgi:hypothetical protein
VCLPSAQKIRIATFPSVLSFDFHRVVVALPAVFVEPKESESNSLLLLLRQWNVHEFEAKRRALRSGIRGVLPVVAGPVQQKRRVRLDSQERAHRNGFHLTIRFPDLNGLAFAVSPDVSVVRWFN